MNPVSAPQPGADLQPGVLRRARKGDADAFAAILRHHDRRLRALAFRMLGDRERMDDVLQEAYVKAYRSLPGFRGDARVGTWLYRIVVNACLDDLRRRPVEVPLVEEADEGVSDAAAAVGERDRLKRALALLPADQRIAVILVDLLGYDYRSAGRAAGVPAGTIASRLNHARTELRLALEEKA